MLILDVTVEAESIAGPPAEQDAHRIAAMPAARRPLFLAARRGAGMALAAVTGCDPACVLIEAPGDTRPRCAGLLCDGPLANAVRDFGIGFSYARDRALVAIARGLQVGVDLEALPQPGARRRRWDAIRAAYFADMPGRIETTIAEGFLAVWTRHEAFLKACGDGITLPAERRDPAAEGYAVNTVDAGAEYVAAVAAKASSFRYGILPASPANASQPTGGKTPVPFPG
ncbi:MAG: hypothetical protein RLT05_03355 [Bauldia litoralis]